MKTFINIKRSLFLLAIVGLLSSCEEVIDVDLNSSNPVLVAEGNIFIGSQAFVRLTLTTDYFDQEETPLVENATVRLTASDGRSEVLDYKSDGVYIGRSILGKVGHSYTLSIEREGQNYDGATTLIAPVDIYDISFAENEFMSPRANEETEVDYVMTMLFSDDPREDNYYMVKYYNDGLGINDFDLVTDIFAENDTIEHSSFFTTFYEGEYEVEVYSIDEDTYNFYSQLSDLDNGGMGGTPYNPKSNFGSDVMGYFSALSWTSESGDVIVSTEE